MKNTIVKFNRDWNAYPKGSRAGFDQKTAEQLSDAKIASIVDGKEEKETKPAQGAVTKGAKASDENKG